MDCISSYSNYYFQSGLYHKVARKKSCKKKMHRICSINNHYLWFQMHTHRHLIWAKKRIFLMKFVSCNQIHVNWQFYQLIKMKNYFESSNLFYHISQKSILVISTHTKANICWIYWRTKKNRSIWIMMIKQDSTTTIFLSLIQKKSWRIDFFSKKSLVDSQTNT